MPKKPLKLTTIRLDEDEMAKAAAIASIKGVSVSWIIRLALHKYINDYEHNSRDQNKSVDAT